MPEEPENQEPPAFVEYEVEGVGIVIAPEGEPGYRVRLPDGRVTAYPALSGEPSEANAAADIAHALANPPPPPVPSVLNRDQFVIALRRVLGMTEGAVYALISQLPAGDEQETARDRWENTRIFRRDSVLLNALAQLNGNTSAEIDEVFRTGAALDLD